jgi:hypothetical protein
VAVVELHPPRARRELVHELAARRNDLEDAVHVRGVDAVEVDRVGVRTLVSEADAQQVVLGRADHRARRGPVVGPRRKRDALRDLDVVVAGDELVLAHPPRLVGQRGRRREQRVDRRVAIDRGRLRPDHRRMTHDRAGVVVALVRRRALGLGEGHPRERAGGRQRRSCDDQLLPTEFRHA